MVEQRSGQPKVRGSIPLGANTFFSSLLHVPISLLFFENGLEQKAQCVQFFIEVCKDTRRVINQKLVREIRGSTTGYCE